MASRCKSHRQRLTARGQTESGAPFLPGKRSGPHAVMERDMQTPPGRVQADRMLNQRPAPGLTNCALPAAASEIPVAPAVPLIVSLVPTAANTCVAAAPLLMTVTSWPPRAGGRATLSAAVAHTAMRLNAAVRGYAAARVPPAVAVIPFWNDAIPAGSNSCGPRLYDMRYLLLDGFPGAAQAGGRGSGPRDAV